MNVTTRSRAAVQVVHQDSVRSTFKGQLQCFRFTSMQAAHWLRLCHGNKLKPRTRRNNPVLYFLRSTRMEQFVPDGKGNEDMVEKSSKDFPAIDQDEIMKRTSVGNDDAAHLFGDAAQTFEI
jgi:hypothetical protein